MRAYGTAQAVTAVNEPTFQGFATTSGRDVVSDLNRAHGQDQIVSPIKLQPLTPAAERALISGSRAPRVTRKPAQPARLPAPGLAKPSTRTPPGPGVSSERRPARGGQTFSAITRARVEAALESGCASISAVAKAAEVSWATAKAHLDALQVRIDGRTQPGIRHVLDADDVVRRYQAGQTVPKIATDLHGYPATVRRILRLMGVELRDDRAGHSGSSKKEYEASAVATVTRLYQAGMSQKEVAEYLHTTAKVIQRLMENHGIPARPAFARPQNVGDHALDHWNLIASLGGCKVIRAWAEQNGIACPTHGLVPTRVVDAYIDRDQTPPRPLAEVAREIMAHRKASPVIL